MRRYRVTVRVMRYGVMALWRGPRYGAIALYGPSCKVGLLVLWRYGVMALWPHDVLPQSIARTGISSVEARHRERRVAATNLSVLDQS